MSPYSFDMSFTHFALFTCSYRLVNHLKLSVVSLNIIAAQTEQNKLIQLPPYIDIHRWHIQRHV